MKRLLALLIALFLLPLPASADPEIVPGSNVNLVARDGRIPVTISNPDTVPIEVTVWAESTSFRLEVLESVTVLVPAASTAIADIPVKALANGPVQIRVWMEVDGVRVGEETVVDIAVNYDIELFLLVSLGMLMFALIMVGIFRTTLKLRRRPVE
ncbi:MAG: DUF6049 family protein [Aquiluna sp.]